MTDDENTAFELSDDEGTVFQSLLTVRDDSSSSGAAAEAAVGQVCMSSSLSSDNWKTVPSSSDNSNAVFSYESSLTVNKDGIVKLAWRDESSGQDGTRLPPRELRVAAWYL
jgi:hypothetical protein